MRADKAPSGRSSHTGCGEIVNKTAKGAIFCHVDKTKPMRNGIPCNTSGSHQWHGAMAIFSITANIINSAVTSKMLAVDDHVFKWCACINPANSRIAEAKACIKKYLIVASVARGWCVLISSGRNAKVLISNPSHIKNQFELSNTIIVPEKTLK